MIALGSRLGSGVDTMPLGRIGSGLALIYHDVVTAPLPPGMTALVKRLEAAMEREAVSARRSDEP